MSRFYTSLLAVTICFILAAGILTEPNSDKADANDTGVACDISAHNSGRFLVKNEKAWFWLGNTSWFLLKQPKNVISEHLDKLENAGFNIFHFAIVSNADGMSPYNGNNINTAYWDNVRWVVTEAKKRGLYSGIALGRLDKDATAWYQKGWYAGNYMKDLNSTIAWIGGFDYNPDTEGTINSHNFQMEGIADAIAGLPVTSKNGNSSGFDMTLMTFHAPTYYWGMGTSASLFHKQDWLDLNWIQTYGALQSVVKRITEDYNRTPAKPTMLAEGAYEATYYQASPLDDPYKQGKQRYKHSKGPTKFYADEYTRAKYDPPGIQPWHARYQAYHSVFAGGCGFEYGHRGLIQTIGEDWSRYNAYTAKGFNSIKYLRLLMESHDMLKLAPDRSMLINPNTKEYYYMLALSASDGSYAYVYSTGGKNVTVKLTKITSGAEVKAQWYDPRTGEYSDAGLHKKKDTTFDPPGVTGVDKDWVLVLTGA